jgi:hypothetical protein
VAAPPAPGGGGGPPPGGGGRGARGRAGPHARRAILELTAAGERVLEAMNMFRRHYLQRLMADWTDAERAEFAGLLRRFTDAALATPPVFAGAEKIFEAARSAPASRRH